MTITELRLAVPETVSVAIAEIAGDSLSFSTVSCADTQSGARPQT
jgi:hypothetical protein